MRRRMMLVFGLVMAGLLAVVTPALADEPGGDGDTSGEIGDALKRLGRDDTGLSPICDEAPQLVVANTLLLFEPSPEDLVLVRRVLANFPNSVIEPVFGGSTFVVVIEPAVDFDTLAAILRELRASEVPAGFNHVLTLSPFWRFRPYDGVHAIDGAKPAEPIEVSPKRPIVVLDTGYPDDVPLPKTYAVDGAAVVTVDRGPKTALHGPFIASQIAARFTNPQDITLVRVAEEKGVLLPTPLGKEQIFDELSVVGTLEDLAQFPEAVVNMSMGAYSCQGFEPLALLGTMRNLSMRGIEFVVAVGNDDVDSKLSYPGALAATTSYIHSVAAHNGEGVRSCYSNFAGASYVAPGDNQVAVLESAAEQFLAAGTGTSFAAPLVTVALAIGKDPLAVDGILPPAAVVGMDGSRSAPCPRIVDDPCARPTHAGSSEMFGTAGDDIMRGTPERDFINGRTGNDIICGYGKNDFLRGRAGDDQLFGGLGSDVLEAGSGNDLLVGDNGNDYMHGGAGFDTCSPGAGSANEVRFCEG